jgi:hypothetical protein
MDLYVHEVENARCREQVGEISSPHSALVRG